jgi:hypothetical protein
MTWLDTRVDPQLLVGPMPGRGSGTAPSGDSVWHQEFQQIIDAIAAERRSRAGRGQEGSPHRRRFRRHPAPGTTTAIGLFALAPAPG